MEDAQARQDKAEKASSSSNLTDQNNNKAKKGSTEKAKPEKKAVVSPSPPTAGEIKKDTVRKSDSANWYQWSKTEGYVKQTRTVKKGTALKTVRPVPDKKFMWAETLEDQSGYLHSKHLKIKTLGSLKTPDFVDKNSLLEPVEGTAKGKNFKDTNREWFLDQAVLMEAYRSLQEKEKERLAANDPEGQKALAATQKQLALAMLQSFAKSAPVDQNVIGDPLGVQSNPTQSMASYHRSGTNPMLDQLRNLMAQDMKVSMTALQVLSDPLFMDVLNREFPVYDKSKELKDAQKVDTNIDSVVKFGTSIDVLLKNYEAGHAPGATFVFNVTPFYDSLACRPDEIAAKLTKPLEDVLIRKAAATAHGKDPQPLVDSLLNHIQLVIITKHKGVDVLVVPKLFKPLTEEEKKALSKEELDLRNKVDDDKRDVFMEAGGHDSRKLDSSMIESGARIDPIAAKEAMLNLATPEKLLQTAGLTSVKLATKGIQKFTVSKIDSLWGLR